MMIWAVCLGWFASVAWAQASVQVQVRAIAGEPLGVAEVRFSYSDAAVNRAGATQPFQVVATEPGRVLYATEALVSERRLLRRARSSSGYFLFSGELPFSITVNGPVSTTIEVMPVPNASQEHRQLLNAWWRAYVQQSQKHRESDNYPQLIENYLTSMLAQRFSLPPPAEDRQRFSLARGNQAQQALGVLSGAESIRLSMQRDTLLERIDFHEPADVYLLPPEGEASPVPMQAVEAALPVDDSGDSPIRVESIAQKVPEECFYIRFGSFSNYQWFRSTLAEGGGDLQNLVAARGLDSKANQRLEAQIALRERALSKVLGPKVISDVAMIGSDFFFQEGAAFGILFEASNNLALTADFHQQRVEAMAANPEITETKLKILDREVSFLSTPDNRVRSFYAIDGNYHFVTTSYHLAKRFLEAGAQGQSLATHPDFIQARTLMPLDQQQSVFVFLSKAFLHQFTGPKYRIEMTRRIQAAVDIELVKLAQQAARHEGLLPEGELAEISQLIGVGLLPRTFGKRPDESGAIFADGQWIDSVRGAAGTFTPIPDVEFDAVTRSEASAYEQFSEALGSNLQQMDPIVVGIQRFKTEVPEIERISIDVHAASPVNSQYKLISRFLGPATESHVTPVPENLISFDAVVQPGLGGLFGASGGGVHHVYGGIQDSAPEYHLDGVELKTSNYRAWVQGYLGTWPTPGLLSLFAIRDTRRLDSQGYGQMPILRVWQRQIGDFMVLAFNRALLEQVTPQLQVVNAPLAQVRLQVNDLTGTDLAKAANAKAYARSLEISQGNVQFLQRLSQQLGVPGEHAREYAEDVLQAKLVCPLGGNFEFSPQVGSWTSDAVVLSANNPEIPHEYVAPPLRWLRGLGLEFTSNQQTMVAHIELLMKRTPEPTTEFKLPAWLAPK